MKHSILQHLDSTPWKDRLIYLDQIDSTNTYAKKLAAAGACHGTVVIAGSQTAGRGRMGRSFHSPEGKGIYLSVILRPHSAASELMHLTCAAGVAMCDAIDAVTGLRPGIKWINDLVYGSKKAGGILTELSLTADGMVDYAVVGIGINCNHTQEDFPADLQAIATSLYLAQGKPVSIALLAAAMIRSLYTMDSTLQNKAQIMDRYRKHCVTLKKEITIHTAHGDRDGFACDIDNDGGLLVQFSDGHTEVISSGEASVRGMYGYA